MTEIMDKQTSEAQTGTSMSFRINVKGLREGIGPASIIATTGVTKECPTANHIALTATPECLYAIANGGRVSIKNPIPFMTTYCTDYSLKFGGTVTVKVADLQAVLASFPDTEVLRVELGNGQSGQELSIRPESDPDEVQTLPVLPVDVKAIDPPKSAAKAVTLNRALFIRSVKRIIFAGGFEENRPRYMYWVLRANKGSARFVAGSGPRFAILDVTGTILDNLPTTDILIPVEPTNVLLNILNSSIAENVTIYQSTPDNTKDLSKNRYLFECGDMRVVVAGFDPGIKWISENDYLLRKNKYRATVSMQDWELAIKGINATNNDETKAINKKVNRVHATNLSILVDKKTLQLQTTGSMKALRKIKLLDLESEQGNSEVAIRLPTTYLCEISKCANGSEYIQLELVDDSNPIIIRFDGKATVSNDGFSKTNSQFSVEETFSVFIAKLSSQ